MSRLALAAVLLSATTVSPAVAHAHARASSSEAFVHGARGASHPAAHSGVSEMCSQASVLVAAQTAALAVHQAVVLPAPALVPAQDEDVPWCVTPDDPRCSPIEHGSLPSQSGTDLKLSAPGSLSIALPRVRELSEPMRCAPAGEARVGQSCRLERPPRDCR